MYSTTLSLPMRGTGLKVLFLFSDFALITNLYYSRGINSRVRRFIIKINIYK